MLLVLDAIYRLSIYAIGAFSFNFGLFEWSILTMWSIFMIFTEGYRGFQKNFSPRVVARAQYLARHGTVLEIILAPLFCIGYFKAPVRRMIAMYSLTLGIIVLIVIIHLLAVQPWRGILDSGVVLGLTYGFISMVFYVIRAFKENDYIADAEVR